MPDVRNKLSLLPRGASESVLPRQPRGGGHRLNDRSKVLYLEPSRSTRGKLALSICDSG